MAQFKVGDKVKFEAAGQLNFGTIEKWNEKHLCWNVMCSDNWTHVTPESLLTHCDYLAPTPLTITATLTTDTIPTDMIKKLSEAGFLITIKAI